MTNREQHTSAQTAATRPQSVQEQVPEGLDWDLTCSSQAHFRQPTTAHMPEPLTGQERTVRYQACCWMPAMVMRWPGSATRILHSRSRQSLEMGTCGGNSYSTCSTLVCGQ